MIKILGIDPGSTRIGYGLVEVESRRKLHRRQYGTLEIPPGPKENKLIILEQKLHNLLAATTPDIIALETLYFAKNKKTALEVAEARGIILLTAAKSGGKIVQYSPNQVKLAVGGYGRADKISVATMVKKILNISSLTGYDDASDALAIAITAAGHIR